MKYIITTLKDYIIEKTQNNIVLYRGVEQQELIPTNKKYNFFAEDKSFAKDYGEFIYECEFDSLNLFISYEKKYIEELYNNGYILQDQWIEDMWDKVSNEMINIYKYDSDNNGYISADAFINSPYSQDTWDAIENSDGVIDYILSEYDGVKLLEGGQITYFIDTSKIKKYTLIN